VIKLKYIKNLAALFAILLLICEKGSSQQIIFKGQLSGWAGYYTGATLPLLAGGRYLPQVNYETKGAEFEVAANIFGNSSIKPFTESLWEGDIKLYRGWAKLTSKRAELRVGLQKINFGSATLLRPLMWFDRVDPRDPLQFTEGVWGALGRYYFRDNSNIWLWALYGNKDSRPWEIGLTSQWRPEFGGRVQIAIPRGEAAISFHRREAMLTGFAGIAENRYAFDIKMDLTVGISLEATWINKRADLGILTNQEMVCAGTDYTFGLGNGLNIIAEHLIFSSDREPLSFSNTMNLTALSGNYPFGMFDSINYILYYDWKNGGVYNFVNWRHTFTKFSLNLMGYINPTESHIPLTGNSLNRYSGSGFQIMLVYNHQSKKLLNKILR